MQDSIKQIITSVYTKYFTKNTTGSIHTNKPVHDSDQFDLQGRNKRQCNWESTEMQEM